MVHKPIHSYFLLTIGMPNKCHYKLYIFYIRVRLLRDVCQNQFIKVLPVPPHNNKRLQNFYCKKNTIIWSYNTYSYNWNIQNLLSRVFHLAVGFLVHAYTPGRYLKTKQTQHTTSNKKNHGNGAYLEPWTIIFLNWDSRASFKSDSWVFRELAGKRIRQCMQMTGS